MSGLGESGVVRISISLPERLLTELNTLVREKQYESRSQAIAEMINHWIVAQKQEIGNEIMAGTITLVYDNSTPGLQKHLADLQFQHVDEVLSSLHVNLAHAHIMEVVLVQGPGSTLKLIADKMGTARGMLSCKLQVTTSIIPPIHPLPSWRGG